MYKHLEPGYEEPIVSGFVRWLCALPGHSFLCEVPNEFVRDKYELEGLKDYYETVEKWEPYVTVNSRLFLAIGKMCSAACEFEDILNVLQVDDPPRAKDLDDPVFQAAFKKANHLYMRIHARYVVSRKGLEILRGKVILREYGTCPRHNCKSAPMIPTGFTTEFDHQRVRVFCPRCQDVFWPATHLESSHVIDAAAFTARCGQSLPMLLLKAFPELVPQEGPKVYIPRIYGFKIVNLAGSKYEYKYDNNGNCLNQKAVDGLLAKPVPEVPPPPKVDFEKLLRPAQLAWEAQYGDMIRQ